MDSNILIRIAELALGLAALIIIHEFGHFSAARLFKIPVEEFGLGFPPRVATLFTSGGTKFTLNLLPIGGFVRPKGENNPDIPDGLAAANPWKRLGVLIAGPMANLLVGVVLYAMIINRIGSPIPDQVQVVEAGCRPFRRVQQRRVLEACFDPEHAVPVLERKLVQRSNELRGAARDSPRVRSSRATCRSPLRRTTCRFLSLTPSAPGMLSLHTTLPSASSLTTKAVELDSPCSAPSSVKVS